jgi:hypothetical protein
MVTDAAPSRQWTMASRCTFRRRPNPWFVENIHVAEVALGPRLWLCLGNPEPASFEIMDTDRTHPAKTVRLSKLLREPTLHFFAVAAAALFAQRLIVGDPLTIEVSSALRADLLRRYHDQLGREPSSAEIPALLAAWKTDEALYREALREGIDREDTDVRIMLINKMRERLLLQTRLREPTDADLQQYLTQHRADFEAPLLYEHEYVTFSKQDPAAAQERAKYAQKLLAGATPAALGLRSTVANVDRARIEQDLGAGLADRVAGLPPGTWQELESADRLFLVKLNRIQGGLPDPLTLRPQLEEGWKAAQAKRALDQATEQLTGRYHFKEEP